MPSSNSATSPRVSRGTAPWRCAENSCFDDQVRSRHAAIDIADVHLKIGSDVGRHRIVKLRLRPVASPPARSVTGAEGLIFDIDQFKGIFGDVTIFRHHHSDRVAHVTHFVDGDGCLEGPFEPGYAAGSHRNRFQSRHVRGGEDADHTRKS